MSEDLLEDFTSVAADISGMERTDIRSILESLLGETPRERGTSGLNYDGSPITARFIAREIGDHLAQLSMKPAKVSS